MVSFYCFPQKFDDHFVDKTLRVDYIFVGDAKNQTIVLDELNQLPRWAGRRHNLLETNLEGQGQIKMYNLETGECIYKNTFSTLFQEWLTVPEALTVSRGFENVFLLPFPKERVRIEVSLRDNSKGTYETKISHIVDPNDILIRSKGYTNLTPCTQMHTGGDIENCINVAIMAEGFRKDEMDSFREYAKQTIDQILRHKPFDKYKDKFNFFVVESPSDGSGVSIPREGKWISTAFNSHFDTFYTERYLTTSNVKAIHDALAGIPYEHVIILANTDVYGGGGIFNSYTLTTTGHQNFAPVVVHEFGHSFGGLADEYYYENDGVFNDTYPLTIEPWEQNITTLVDFKSKWEDMLLPKTPVPTNLSDSLKYNIGVYEGAGYSSKGIYRSRVDCRMKSNACKDFCSVCQRSLERLIEFYIYEN